MYPEACQRYIVMSSETCLMFWERLKGNPNHLPFEEAVPRVSVRVKSAVEEVLDAKCTSIRFAIDPRSNVSPLFLSLANDMSP